MAVKWDLEKSNLQKYILEDKLSYEDIGKIYGCSGSNIRKVSTRLGIELPKRRKINECETFNKGKTLKEISICLNCNKEFIAGKSSTGTYCCSNCHKEHQHKELYKKILNGDESIMRANYSPKIFREDIIKEQDGVCAICGMKPEWNSKPLVFIIDHIDGNAANNKRDNLRCICPNCDSQLDTYKSKNKNGARSYYRYHKYDEETKIGN